ncbi:ImmA/IrrE family metallo-endopeptidase [Paenibacillus rigui]|nr:ImmA/IrrE family metallo-endopeptidase [Paenibacillus rigui]
MELHYYKPTDLETWISKKYQENGIHYASDLDIDHIASIFNITVKTTKGESKAIWDEDYSLILLHGYLTEEQKREHFFHELCHPIKHVGNQNSMPRAFQELQEIQAAHFQLYAAMPAYMLEEFKEIKNFPTYIKVLSEEFKLSVRFIEKRIEQIQRRINQARMDHQFLMSRMPVKVRYEQSQIARAVIDKLSHIKARKGAL